MIYSSVKFKFTCLCP